ncbi:MAG: molecular chaperone GroEL [Granulosicoccus sp.]|nr:molecular chaperone GroEL [Granulosicoccus sp.]
MSKMMLHDAEARTALARGVEKLSRAVHGTLGPKGMNAIIDRPIGTPIISRDGVSIADEIELPDRFENMGAQVLREVAGETNHVAGDGTTTATVLANALVQEGLSRVNGKVSPVDIVAGIELAVEFCITELQQSAVMLNDHASIEAVATIASNDKELGKLIAEAIDRVGPEGTVSVDVGMTVSSSIEFAEGMTFDRGYISHHMVTDVEKMQAVLDNPLILMTDRKITSPTEIEGIRAKVAETGRPLLIIADDVSPDTIVELLQSRERDGLQVAAIHPPDYGHWRKSMFEDLAVLTGGRVIAQDLGGMLETMTLDDLGSAEQIRISANETIVHKGGGDEQTIRARRAQVSRQHDDAPPNIERDKFAQRLARLSGGTALILAGGATPVEQHRRAQLIEDALNAARAAAAEGVVAGGGTALIKLAPKLDSFLDAGNYSDEVKVGISLVRRALEQPLRRIAANAGRNPEEILTMVQTAGVGIGHNARTGQLENLVEAGVMDPVKVTYTALRNAASVASLILTTQTLIADIPEYDDPTSGPAMGGGGELLE